MLLAPPLLFTAALLTLSPANSTQRALRMTEANHRGYAQRHGYMLHTLAPVDDGGRRHPVWSKVLHLLSIVHLYDWVWMIDDDALVMNAALPLTDFIDDRFNLIVRREEKPCAFGRKLPEGACPRLVDRTRGRLQAADV